MKHNIPGKQRDQPIHIAPARSLKKTFQQVALRLLRDLEAWAHRADMLLGAAQNLAAIGFTLSENSGNLRILVFKDLAEQEHRPLHRRQTLQQNEEGHGKRLI